MISFCAVYREDSGCCKHFSFFEAFNTITHTWRMVGVWYGDSVEALVVHTNLNLKTLIYYRDQQDEAGLLWLRCFNYTSLQILVYVLTKLFSRLLTRVVQLMADRACFFSLRSIVLRVALKVPRLPLHKFLSFEKIPIISFFNTSSSMKERYTIKQQFCGDAAWFTRSLTRGSCCLEAGPSLVSIDHDKSNSKLVGMEIVSLHLELQRSGQ